MEETGSSEGSEWGSASREEEGEGKSEIRSGQQPSFLD